MYPVDPELIIFITKIFVRFSVTNSTIDALGLFESLDSQGRPDSKDRRMWLSLHSGSQWARNSKAGRNEISKTRLSYTGTLYAIRADYF